jgi:eukaryotic-like serine/threonine-protein kinase
VDTLLFVAEGALDSLPARVGSKYRPVRCLARGGMGVVYEVENVNTLDRWALKVLTSAGPFDPGSVDRLVREARTVARLKCENVVQVIDVDVAPELGGAPFLVMELLEGTTLAAVAGSPIEPAEVVRWLAQVGRALGRAHAAGVVHRDLKPENLFLTRREDGSEQIKVLDFGVAKVREAESGSVTRSGAVVGTPLYMAPEQARAESDRIAPATDVWALGMTAYRLLTGEDYWQGNGVSVLLAKIVYESVTPPSARGHDLGPGFDAWFMRSCRADPAERWTSVGAQVEALAEVFACPLPRFSAASSAPRRTSPTTDAPTLSLAGATTETTHARQMPRRRWVALTLGVVLVAALVGLVGVGKAPPGPVSTAAPSVAPRRSAAALAPARVVTSSQAVPSASATPSRPRPAPAVRRPPPVASEPESVPDVPPPDPLADPH